MGGAGKVKVSVINEAVAGHTVNQLELNALDVSFVPQGVRNAALLRTLCIWLASAAPCRVLVPREPK